MPHPCGIRNVMSRAAGSPRSSDFLAVTRPRICCESFLRRAAARASRCPTKLIFCPGVACRRQRREPACVRSAPLALPRKEHPLQLMECPELGPPRPPVPERRMRSLLRLPRGDEPVVRRLWHRLHRDHAARFHHHARPCPLAPERRLLEPAPARRLQAAR